MKRLVLIAPIKVCGFDGSIPGYEKRQLEDLDKQALMQRMQKTVEA